MLTERFTRLAWLLTPMFLNLLCFGVVNSPRAEDTPNRIDFKYMYYSDKNGVLNHTPTFNWMKRLSHDWTFQWGQEFDVVSGASRRLGANLTGKLGNHGVDAVSGASQRKVTGKPFANPWKDPAFDAVSGASQSEFRHSENPSITYSKQGHVYTAGIYFSDESDYRSYVPSLSIAHDFNDRNTTLSASGSWFFDDFHPQGAFSGQGGSKQIQSLTLSGTQVFSQLTLVSLTVGGIYSQGYLGHPYLPIQVDSGLLIEENVPDHKTSWTLSGQLIQGYHMGEVMGSIHLDMRHYLDTWAMSANDADLQWYQYFGDDKYLRLRARIYQQSVTAFYKDRYSGNERYRSADIRFSAFTSLTLGAKVSLPLSEDWLDHAWLPDHLDLSYDYGMRNTRGDQGTSQPYLHYQLFPHSEFYSEGTFMLGLTFDL